MNYSTDDPRGVFDKALAFSDALHRACRIQEIRAELRSLRERVCGNCRFWMCSNDCPREHNVKGISRGPSMRERACEKFADGFEPWKAEREAALREELNLAQGASS